MPVPTWSVGQVLAAADVNNWFVPLAAYKAASTARSTTTVTADPDLTINMAASAVYDITVAVVYSATISGTGMNWVFGVPTGASGLFAGTFNLSGTGITPVGAQWTTAAVAGTPATTNQGMLLSGTLSTSGAGTFSFNWASNTSGNTVQVVSGKLIARRIG